MIKIVAIVLVCSFYMGCASTQKNYDYNKWCVKRNEIGECISWSNKKK